MPDRPQIPLVIALLPVVILIALLALNVFVFGDDALFGSNQIVLILSAAVAAVFAVRFGRNWEALQAGAENAIRIAVPAILILLMVGSLSGTWLLSGVVPSMIYYGLFILSPGIFLVAAVIISALVSLVTGSSWSTTATIGIALMGIGQALGISPGLIAGAILSGAYFGDKLSPLSDTTNLASGVSGTDLFTHLRYLMLTTVPSICITLVIFFAISVYLGSQGAVSTEEFQAVLAQRFNISPWLMVVPATVILMIVKKIQPLPAIFLGSLLGGVFAVIFQLPLVTEVGESVLGEAGQYSIYVGLIKTFFGDIAITTGNASLDGLLTAGGMGGMLNTVWLIIAAMVFGGIMEASGFLQRITDALIAKATTPAKLVMATAGTCMFTNVSASDQYLSIVVPGRMYTDAYDKAGLAPQNLSRTLEDSGTVTSVLVPWNTCGAYHAGVLGVATLAYAPYAFFSLISPVMTVFIMWLGWRVVMAKQATAQLT